MSGQDVLLSWDAGATDGTQLVREWYLSSGFTFYETLSASQTTYQLTDLEPGEYEYHLSAIGDHGESPGASVTFTVEEAPAPVSSPTDLRVSTTPVRQWTGAGSSLTLSTFFTATLTWGEPTEGSAHVTGYDVTGPAGTVTLDAAARSHTITDLDVTQAHSLTVTPRTARGAGASASVTTEAGRVPSAPRDPAVEVFIGASLKWTAPEDTGGLPVLRYEVTLPSGTVTVPATTTSASLWGLKGNGASLYPTGATYSFSVVAVNAAGRSAPVTMQWVRHRTSPSAPFVNASASGTKVSISWSSPTDVYEPAFSGYRVTVPNRGTFDVPATQKNLVVDDVYGTVTVTVAARTDLPNGMSNVSADGSARVQAGHRAPGAPVALKASLNRTDATITWLEPTTLHGHDSLTWTIDWGTGRTTRPADQRSVVIKDLPRGVARTVKVWAAGNRSNDPGAAATVTVKPGKNAPTAPRSLAGKAKNGTATITWKAPSDNGGTKVTGYRLVYKGKTIQKPKASATKATVKGFKKGETRSFTLYAVNSVGAGASRLVNVTQFGKPDTPTGTAVRLGWSTTLNVAWKAPKNTGGSHLTTYKVEYRQVDRAGYNYPNTKVKTKSVKGDSTTTGDLSVAKGYWKARVKACSDVGCSGWSKWSPRKQIG